MLTTLIYVPICKKMAPEFVQDLKFGEIHSDSDTVFKQNEKALAHAIAYMIISLVLAAISGILFTIPSEKDPDMFFIYSLIQQHFPEWKYLLTWGFKCSVVPLACISAMSPAHYLIYGLVPFKLQVNVLLHNIENINKNYEKNEFLNSESQNVINERLLSCLKHHIKISRYCKTSPVILVTIV